MTKRLYREAREVSINTPINTLREIEQALIEDNSDEADLCLPRVESCIEYILAEGN